MSVTLNELLSRSAAGGLPDPKRMYRPSTAYALFNDPFGFWCDCHVPSQERVEEEDPVGELRMKWGVEYEAAWIAKNFPDAVQIKEETTEASLRETLQAMLDGAKAIAQPQVWLLSEGLYGRGDVLVRCGDRPSDLGDYHYTLTEIKHSRELQEYHEAQAGAYNHVLGQIQGYTPQEFQVVLRDARVEKVPHARGKKLLDVARSLWTRIRDNTFTPEIPSLDGVGAPWRVYANGLLRKRGDLLSHPGMTAKRKQRLLNMGITTIPQFTALTLTQMRQDFDKQYGEDFYYREQARNTPGGILMPAAKPVIPRRKRHLYFDFEDANREHPVHGPHVYLIGLVDLEAGQTYQRFLARGPSEEAQMFRAFIEYVGAGSSDDIALYHWYRHEVTEMTKAAERHSALAEEIKRMIDCCVDLMECIKGRIYLPTRGNSIKEVAPALGFNWRGDDVDGRSSMGLYWKWLDGGDDALIQRVIDYNEDDCRSMIHVDRRISDFAGIAPPPHTQKGT